MEQWKKWERDATRLETWLRGALGRLHELSSLDNTELMNVGALQHKISLFLVSNYPLTSSLAHSCLAPACCMQFTSGKDRPVV